jgi:flavorubredoxin
VTQLSEAGIETLADDRVFTLGASIPNDGLITWLPAHAEGYVPLNVHLLVEGRSGLLVDTSFPVIEETLVAQAALFDLDTVTVAFTRGVEFDSVGNAEVLLDVLPVDAFYAHFDPIDWVYFRPTDTRSTRQFGSYIYPDDNRLVVAPGREIEVLDTRLKLLATAWLYDPETKILFSSDSFSHVLTADPRRRVVTAADDTTNADEVRDHLLVKFDWLEGADTEPIRRYLDSVFDEHDVEVIAPSHGCVLSGRSVVERHYAMLDDALRDVARRVAA